MKAIRTLAVVLALKLIVLTGCATPQYNLQHSNVYLHVTVTDDLPANTLGKATFYPSLNLCLIQLREYPVCLLHEIRHCLEGHWHPPDEANSDYCY